MNVSQNSPEKTMRITVGGTLLSRPYSWIYLLVAAAACAYFLGNRSTFSLDLYSIVGAIIGAAGTYLITLSVANALHASPGLRIGSSVGMLGKILLAAFLWVFVPQLIGNSLLVGLSPDGATTYFILRMSAAWIAFQLLTGVFALHSSRLTATFWSRSVLFGFITLMLYWNSLMRLLSEVIAPWVRALDSGLAPDTILGRLKFEQVAVFIESDLPRLVGDVSDRVLAPVVALEPLLRESASIGDWQRLSPATLIFYALVLFALAGVQLWSKQPDQLTILPAEPGADAGPEKDEF